MNVPSKVVHESATQRQHIRVHLPVAVKFGGREYPAVNWSVAGLLLADVFDPPTPGLIIPLELVFDFEGFAFNLELTGELLRAALESGRADRKSVVSGKRVSVRVDLGGRRKMKKYIQGNMK